MRKVTSGYPFGCRLRFRSAEGNEHSGVAGRRVERESTRSRQRRQSSECTRQVRLPAGQVRLACIFQGASGACIAQGSANNCGGRIFLSMESHSWRLERRVICVGSRSPHLRFYADRTTRAIACLSSPLPSRGPCFCCGGMQQASTVLPTSPPAKVPAKVPELTCRLPFCPIQVSIGVGT